MTGFNLVLKLRRLEEQVNALGFMFAHSRHEYYKEYGDVVALKPKDDGVPIYSRDAEVFVGSLQDLEQWIRGVEWARSYDQMLRISDDKKRFKKEEQFRHARMLAELTKDHTNEEQGS